MSNEFQSVYSNVDEDVTPEVKEQHEEIEEVEDVVEEEVVVDEVHEEVSDVEAQARSQGWRPQSEWKGDPDDWVSAKVFVKNGEFINSMHSLKQKVSNYDTVINEQAAMIKKLMDNQRAAEERGRQAVLSALEEELVLAREDNDHRKALEIEKKIKQAQDYEPDLEVGEIEVKPTTPQTEAKEFTNFKATNPWYGVNEDLTDEAELIGAKFVRNLKKSGEQLNLAELYDHVANEIRSRHPQVFGLGKPGRRQTIMTGSNRQPTGKASGGKSEYTYNDLSSDAKKVCDTWVRKGLVKSRQDYVDKLAAIGGIESAR